MLDGVTVASGAIDGNGIQVGKQFAEITAISSYAFVVSCALLYILKYIPFLKLRVSKEGEERGLDFEEFKEEDVGDWSLFERANKVGGTAVVEGKSSEGSEGVRTPEEGVLAGEKA